MDHVDAKYVSLLSTRLEKFKKVKPTLYNFRCPICGDSKKSKNRTRGYLYSVKTNTNFKCHNCGASMSFNNFLKKIDTVLHKQYTMEKFKEGFTGKNFVVEEPELKFEKPVFKKKINLPRASENPAAEGYLTARKLDPSKFYFAEKFKSFVNSYKQTFENTKHEESRIIIPLFYNHNLIGFQGRSLGLSKVKYITVMLDDDAPKIYGLDEIDQSKPVYVTEGPFDSTFIRNAIAMCGADADISKWGISNPVWIYDNEPRNREIVNRINRTIDSGDSIVIWPSNIDDKDINDMVMSGHDVQNLVESHTYSGLEAQLKFNLWKKI
jgi:transcription elongation factor Elf1